MRAYEGLGDKGDTAVRIAPLLTNIVLVGWSGSVCAILGEFAVNRMTNIVRRPRRTSFTAELKSGLR